MTGFCQLSAASTVMACDRQRRCGFRQPKLVVQQKVSHVPREVADFKTSTLQEPADHKVCRQGGIYQRRFVGYQKLRKGAARAV